MSGKIIIVIFIIVAAIGGFIFWQNQQNTTSGSSSSSSSSSTKKPSTLAGLSDTPPVLDTSSPAALEASTKNSSADAVMKAVDANLTKKLAEQQKVNADSGVNREDRICGAANKVPCKPGFIQQETTDPIYAQYLVDFLNGDTAKKLKGKVNCCVLDPKRNDPAKVNLAITIATGVAEQIAVQAGVHIATNIAKKVASTFAREAASISSKVGSRIASKVALKLETSAASAAEKILAKEAVQVLEKTVVRSAEKAAVTIAEKAAVKAATLAAKEGAKAGMGPLGWASMAFDILSIGLDIAGVGGYDDVTLLPEIVHNRDKANNTYYAALAKAGSPIPQLAGPISKLPDKDPNPKPDPKDPKTYDDILTLIETEYCLSYAEHIFDQIPNPQEFSADEHADMLDQLQDKAMKFFDTEEGMEYLRKRACEYIKGVYKNKQCMYPDKDTCDKSYNWQKIEENIKDSKKWKDDPEINYAEWRYVKQRDSTGAEIASSTPEWMCITVDPSIKSSCTDDGNNFEYDYEKQLCKISDTYCRQHGMDPIQTPNGTDCKIGTAQNIAEMIFGTTITRGLIQVFDPAQYKPCRPGDYDMYNVPSQIKPLLNAIPIYGMLGNKMCVTPYKCPANKDMDAGLCYDKCRAGNHGIGPVCWQDTPAGAVDVGALIRDGCRAGFHDVAGVCWGECPAGAVNVGALCRDGCRAGFHDVAGVCWGDTPPNSVDVGALYRDNCRDGYHDVAGVCWGNCPAGSVDTGALCRDGCRGGYHDVAGVCWEDTPGGSVDVGALIRDGCRGGYHDVAGVCWNNNGLHATCRASSWSLVDDACWQGGDSYVPTTRSRNSYVPPTNTKPSYVPATHPKTSYVPATNPKPSYVPKTNPRGSYGRGVGTLPFSVYVKERLVPYGKKK
jgi:hypothetical protein